jgi:hypothetical protein
MVRHSNASGARSCPRGGKSRSIPFFSPKQARDRSAKFGGTFGFASEADCSTPRKYASKERPARAARMRSFSFVGSGSFLIVMDVMMQSMQSLLPRKSRPSSTPHGHIIGIILGMRSQRNGPYSGADGLPNEGCRPKRTT